jgi:hypothetical protein
LIIELENDLGKESNADLLLKFFREYIKEFHTHIGLEEREVFPYVLMLGKCIEEKPIARIHGAICPLQNRPLLGRSQRRRRETIRLKEHTY